MLAVETQTDSQGRIQEAIQEVTALASLPEVTQQIVQTVQDPHSTPSQLHKIISHDPALVARILKVVNSAFYGLPGQVASVERALVLLGLNAVKNIAIAASLGQLFRSTRICKDYTARDLWTHCITVAVAARELARQLKLPAADEAFLSGMIHDLGLIVSLQVAPQKLAEVCEQAKSGGDFLQLEQSLIGMDHQQLGAALAERWKFPRTCQLVAGFHHRPATLGSAMRMQSAVVHVADTLCGQAGCGFALTASRQTLDAHTLSDLGISPQAVEHLRTRIPTLAAEAAAIFR